MSDRVSSQSKSDVGRVLSIWMRWEMVAKLKRLADAHGVSRNKMVSVLIERADEPTS